MNVGRLGHSSNWNLVNSEFHSMAFGWTDDNIRDSASSGKNRKCWLTHNKILLLRLRHYMLHSLSPFRSETGINRKSINFRQNYCWSLFFERLTNRTKVSCSKNPSLPICMRVSTSLDPPSFVWLSPKLSLFHAVSPIRTCVRCNATIPLKLTELISFRLSWNLLGAAIV